MMTAQFNCKVRWTLAQIRLDTKIKQVKKKKEKKKKYIFKKSFIEQLPFTNKTSLNCFQLVTAAQIHQKYQQ